MLKLVLPVLVKEVEFKLGMTKAFILVIIILDGGSIFFFFVSFTQ